LTEFVEFCRSIVNWKQVANAPVHDRRTPASCRLKRRGGPRELLLDDRPVEQGCDDTERYWRRSSDTQTDGESKETAPNGSPAEVMGRSPVD
jgi:hypothetical protein